MQLVYYYLRERNFKMQFNDNDHLNMTNISDPNIKIGLNDTVCKYPKFFCLCHKLYLGPDDVETKHCMHKMTPDMIGYTQCRWLVDSNVYDEKILEKNRNINNNRLSKVNNRL